MTRTSLVILCLFVAAAVLGPTVAPYHPRRDVDAPLQAPSPRHRLGTDDVGRDILSQVIAGSRVSLTVGLIAGLAATAVGVTVGLAAGYGGRAADALLMRTVDVFLCLPRLPLLILLAAYLGTGLWVIVAAFATVAWAVPARVVRAQVLLEKQRAYVASARLAGGRGTYIVRRHILPALWPLLTSIVVMETGQAIMVEAGLSFLGLGDPTRVSWGTILRNAFDYPALFLGSLWISWALPAGLCLSLLLLALAALGTCLDRHLDPRLKGARLA